MNSKTYPAGLGMHVVLDLVGPDGTERLELDIVKDDYADFRQGFLGLSAPLAKAIQNCRAGRVIPYRVGGNKEIRLLSVSPSEKAPDKDIAQRREDTLRKAVDQSDRMNAVLFASSFSGKWGDYDPTGFGEEQEKEDDEESGKEAGKKK